MFFNLEKLWVVFRVAIVAAIAIIPRTIEAITLVKCIKVGEVNFGEWTKIEPIKTCYMNTQTSIDSKGFSINHSVANATFGLFMNYNKDIVYLPESVPDVFPYLQAYAAANCAIEEVYKENFDGLVHVRFLNLAGNKISEIVSNTFRSLESLERLSMDNNQIKFMEAKMFLPSKSIEKVWLTNNQCIDENFTDEESIGKFLSVIDKKCGVVYKSDLNAITNEITENLKKIFDEKTENLIKQLKEEIEKLKNKGN